MRLNSFSETQTLPTAVADRLKGKRILVVDDFELDAIQAARKLAPLSLPPFNCSIFIATGPEAALTLWGENAVAGTPFDLLVSDLAMESWGIDGVLTGMNGDVLVKRMAEIAVREGFSIPSVVFHSASHARGLQLFTLNELEAIRRRDALTLDQASDLMLEGVPITLVTKTGPAPVLWHAANQVLRLSAVIPRDRYLKHLGDLKVGVYETNLNAESIIKSWRIVAHMSDIVGDAIDLLEATNLAELTVATKELEAVRGGL